MPVAHEGTGSDSEASGSAADASTALWAAQWSSAYEFAREGAVAVPGSEMPREVRHRLARVALSIAALYLVFLAIRSGAVVLGFVPAEKLRASLVLAPFWLLASGLLWWSCLTRRLSAPMALRAALFYEVVLCLLLSISEWWSSHSSMPFRGVSWACPLIIGFTLLVPTTPRITFLTAVLAASTGPAAAAVASLCGLAMPSAPQMVLYFSWSYLFAFAAYMLSSILHRLNKEALLGREIGSYLLLERLGAGGMGEVWKASHRMLTRPSAIKLIRPDVLRSGTARDAQTLLKRFEREARATARLRSPHTVELYDYGISKDGTFYYVMEYLEGLDLASLVDRYGPLPPQRVVHILKQVCLSLIDAHESGLIHRDIKPANIFLCKLGVQCDYVKVLDFGLVLHHVDESLRQQHSEPRLTQPTMIQGTPAFIAPELATGELGVDGRADLYSLGCVGYWLLTGQWVFEAKTAVRIVSKHVESIPVLPSVRSQRDIPNELERLVMWCLEKSREQRPTDGRALLNALEHLPPSCQGWRERDAVEWWRLRDSAPPALRGERAPSMANENVDTSFRPYAWSPYLSAPATPDIEHHRAKGITT